MSKLLLALKSPGNWMIVLASVLGIVQQVRPCLSGRAALAADSALGLIGAVGVVWNTLHLHDALMTQPPKSL